MSISRSEAIEIIDRIIDCIIGEGGSINNLKSDCDWIVKDIGNLKDYLFGLRTDVDTLREEENFFLLKIAISILIDNVPPRLRRDLVESNLQVDTFVQYLEELKLALKSINPASHHNLYLIPLYCTEIEELISSNKRNDVILSFLELRSVAAQISNRVFYSIRPPKLSSVKSIFYHIFDEPKISIVSLVMTAPMLLMLMLFHVDSFYVSKLTIWFIINLIIFYVTTIQFIHMVRLAVFSAVHAARIRMHGIAKFNDIVIVVGSLINSSFISINITLENTLLPGIMFYCVLSLVILIYILSLILVYFVHVLYEQYKNP